jgi:hypothetical protein
MTGWDEVIKIVLDWGVTMGADDIIFLIIYFTALYTNITALCKQWPDMLQ